MGAIVRMAFRSCGYAAAVASRSTLRSLISTARSPNAAAMALRSTLALISTARSRRACIGYAVRRPCSHVRARQPLLCLRAEILCACVLCADPVPLAVAVHGSFRRSSSRSALGSGATAKTSREWAAKKCSTRAPWCRMLPDKASSGRVVLAMFAVLIASCALRRSAVFLASARSERCA